LYFMMNLPVLVVWGMRRPSCQTALPCQTPFRRTMIDCVSRGSCSMIAARPNLT
jgi:hypothetical protein